MKGHKRDAPMADEFALKGQRVLVTGARERILDRIRLARRAFAGDRADEQRGIERNIQACARGPYTSVAGDLIAHFCERALLLASSVDQIPGIEHLANAVAAYLKSNDLPRNAVAWPEFGDLDWHGAGIDAVFRPSHESDLVGVTGAYCAIAETGTLMLLSGALTPAATSMLPETHIAVVRADRIVAHMEDAFALLRAERETLPRAVHFVSGPSRTADIEQTIVLGAHGPYRVHILLVGSGTGSGDDDRKVLRGGRHGSI